MKKRITKLILSFLACICLVIGFSVSASADILGGAGLLGSALGSLGVDLLAGGSATVATLAPWLNGDFSIIGALTGVADGYIKVGDDSVIIDGVEYESIYLNPSMAAELHTQAFDFITQKAITSNSSGILATGVGFVNNVAMYQLSGSSDYFSQSVLYSSDGSYTELGINTTIQPATTRQTGTATSSINGSTSTATLNDYPNRFPWYAQYRVYRSSGRWYAQVVLGNTVSKVNGNGISNGFTEDSFDYSYVSGTIDATPLPVDYGFQAFVPSLTLAQAGFVPGTYVIDGGTGTDAIIDLIQLLDDIYGQEEILDAEFVDEIVPPVPPQPIDTPLGEVPYEDFLDTFGQSVYGKLDSISDGIDSVGQVIAGQGTDIIEAVDTAGQSVVEELEVIGGAIDTAGQSVVDSVEESTGIIEDAIEAVEAKVDELVDSIAEVIEEIMTHPLDLFSAWLDRLPEIPAIKDIFDGIKRHVGIWHYVVEWLGCIGTFLAFFIGLFGDVAYCMVVPIYACVAGAICLAFYKRFAR